MNCKECNIGQMVMRPGKNSTFMGCDQYPACKNTESVPKDTPVAATPQTKGPEDFHLCIEMVRAKALECAIKSLHQKITDYETSVVIELAVAYEAYIMVGK